MGSDVIRGHLKRTVSVFGKHLKRPIRGPGTPLLCMWQGVCSNLEDGKQALDSENHHTTSYVTLTEVIWPL